MAALGPITHITIHCAATPQGREVSSETMNRWAMDRFGQRSYHYIILLNGDVVANLPLTRRGAHTGGRNTGNIGICYVGGMDRDMKRPMDTRTSAQKSAMESLVKELKYRFPDAKILGHRDWPKTLKACPSFSVAQWLKEIGL